MDLQDERTVYVVVTGNPSDEDDNGVEGIYEIGVSGHLAEGQGCEAALDQFHDHIGIGCLDDFRIRVLDGTGRDLDRLDEYENGELAGHAEYDGPIGVDNAPDPVASAFRESAEALKPR